MDYPGLKSWACQRDWDEWESEAIARFFEDFPGSEWLGWRTEAQVAGSGENSG